MTRANGKHLLGHPSVPYGAGGFQHDELVAALCNPTSDTLDGAERANSTTCVQDISSDAGVRGLGALERNEVAVVILAGGMGSRLGQRKWDVCIPVMDIPARMLRMAMARVAGLGRVFDPPIWYLVPPAHDADAGVVSGDPRPHFLVQDEWIETDVMFEPVGSWPMGTGNLVHRLRQDEAFQHWVAGGGRYVYTVAVDNVFANPDCAMLGDHIASGADASWEVVDRRKSDESEHVLVWSEGRRIAVRPERLHPDFSMEDCTTVTDTAIINVSALGRLNGLPRPRRVRAVRSDRVALHLEQDLQELTEVLDARFVRVPREVRFLPIRHREDREYLRGILEGHQIIPDWAKEG